MSATSDAAATAITNAIEAMAPADVQVLLKVMKEWMAQEEPYWGGGASQPIVLRPDTITTGTMHEIVDGWLGLKKAYNFSLWSGLTMQSNGIVRNRLQENVGSLTAANCDENMTVAGGAYWEHGAGTSTYWAGVYTAPMQTRGPIYLSATRPQVYTARVSLQNPNAFPEAGILWYDSANKANRVKLSIRYDGAAYTFSRDWNNNWATFGTITAGEAATGVWLQLASFPQSSGTNWIVGNYSKTASATPPTTGWTLGYGGTGMAAFTAIQYGRFIVQPTAGGACHIVTLYEDDSGMADAPFSTADDFSAAQGYDTLSTALQILTDYNDGGATSLTEIRALLTGLQAKVGTTAALQCSCKRAAAAGAVPTTWNVPAATVVDGAGDLLSIWLRWVSDGTQPGSVLVAPQLVLGG